MVKCFEKLRKYVIINNIFSVSTLTRICQLPHTDRSKRLRPSNFLAGYQMFKKCWALKEYQDAAKIPDKLETSSAPDSLKISPINRDGTRNISTLDMR